MIIQEIETTVLRGYLNTLNGENYKIFDQHSTRYGYIRLRSIESAFELMQNPQYSSHIQFRHTSYSNWNVQHNNEIIKSMQILNSDCLLHIFGFLNIADLLQLSKQSDRLFDLVSEEFKTLQISQSTVKDDIGILNFAYVMKLYGHSIANLFVSLDSFGGKVFGIHTFQMKYTIILIINMLTSSRLKSVHLHRLSLSMEELSQVDRLFRVLRNRAVRIKIT